MRKIHYSLILCLLYVFFNHSYLVYGQYVKHIGVNDGLSGRQVFSIQQDAKGLMWFSTRFGIDRYDGSRIKNYPLDILYQNRTPVIESHLLYNKAKDELWCYTSNGTFYRYNKNIDSFSLHFNTGRYQKTATLDGQGRIWFGGDRYLGLIEHDSLRKVNFSLSPGTQIKELQYSQQNGLVVVTTANLFALSKNNKATPLIPQQILASLNLNIECAFIDTLRDVIWIGTLNKGLYRYQSGSHKIEQIGNPDLNDIPILTLKIKNQEVLIGTDGAGFYIYDINLKQLTSHYSQNEERPFYISSNAIYCIMNTYNDDGSSQIWLSTFSNGINVISKEKEMFHSIPIYDSEGKMLPSQRACSLIENSDGTLWIASDLGICCYNPQKHIWKRILHNINVITLFRDSKNNIWAGTYSAGLILFDSKGKIVKQWRKQDYPLLGTDFIFSISEDSKGQIWIGGKKGRTSILNPTSGEFTNVDIYQVNYITPKNDSIMLIASEDGIHYYNLNTKQLGNYDFTQKLKSLYVCDIYQESDSILWIATYGNGINRCNTITNEVEYYTKAEGLLSNVIYALLPYGNELWYSSERGIGRFNRKSHRINNFTRTNGMFGDHFSQQSRTSDSNGNFYFGSYEGIIKFNPANIINHHAQGHIFFDSFSLFNKIINSQTTHSPLKEHINDTHKIILKHWQHSFSISFTAIDYSNHQANHFEWRLEGLNNVWEKRSGEQNVSYTNLQPGNYNFHLRYVDETGTVLDDRQLSIVIRPPFWQEPWARIIEVLILLTLVTVIANYIRIRLNKKQAEAKVKFFITMAHDIRTPLMLINSPLIQLKEEINPTPATQYLFNLITVNLDKLNKMLSQLLDFQKVYEKREQLFIRKHNLNLYLQKKADYWKNFTGEKKITLNLTLPQQETEEWFDEEKMDDILDNLIINAFKYTPEKGSIGLSLTVDEKAWHITVSDTGIGISHKEQKKLFTRFFRATNAINTSELGTGLGLYIIKQYVMLHKGDISVWSEEGRGTCFTINMQHGNSHFLHDELHEYILPVEEEKPATNTEIHKVKTAEKEKKHYRLLVVDDNSELREYLKRVLTTDYQVYTASNGQEAWQLMGQTMPDIVISDLQMPVMDGIELCRTIKDNFETSHIPVIIVTVNEEKVMLKQSYEAGADDYIKKPFDIMILQSKINNIMKGRTAIQQKYIGLNGTLQKGNEPTDPNENFLAQVRQVIEKHLPEGSFGVNELSDELHLSRSVLYNKFSSMTGYTPNDYIKLIRINKAILYMKEKRYSIKEIALMVGFEEASYFSTCFKKIHGVSPKQFMDELISKDKEQT